MNEKIIELYRNADHFKEMENPSGESKSVSSVCGDSVKFFLKIEGDVIIEASYSTTGCMAIIASSEAICRIVESKSLKVASNLNLKMLNEFLGNVPDMKTHCLENSMNAFHQALLDYYSR